MQGLVPTDLHFEILLGARLGNHIFLCEHGGGVKPILFPPGRFRRTGVVFTPIVLLLLLRRIKLFSLLLLKLLDLLQLIKFLLRIFFEIDQQQLLELYYEATNSDVTFLKECLKSYVLFELFLFYINVVVEVHLV